MFAFFKLMAAHPDIQRRAQAEIDSVLGAERLPVISDMDRLPYTYACCLETMRYHVVAPFGECEDRLKNFFEDKMTTNYARRQASRIAR